MAGYERWLREVHAGDPPRRDSSSGSPATAGSRSAAPWGYPCPHLPFPHENSTADYLARAEDARA